MDYKLFIGGAQVRPDQGYSRKILSPSGTLLAESQRGTVRHSHPVEAAHAAEGWARRAATIAGGPVSIWPRTWRNVPTEFAQRMRISRVAPGSAGAARWTRASRGSSPMPRGRQVHGGRAPNPIRGVTLP